MYYEEKTIDGILHYRTHPKEEFMQMTARMLTHKLEEARKDFNRASLGETSVSERENAVIAGLEERGLA